MSNTSTRQMTRSNPSWTFVFRCKLDAMWNQFHHVIAEFKPDARSTDLCASSGVLLNGSFWCTPYCSHRSHICGFSSFWNLVTLTSAGDVCCQYWRATWNCSGGWGEETRDNIKPLKRFFYWLSQTINMFRLLLYLRNTQTSSCVWFHLAACLCSYSDLTLTEQQSQHRRMMAHWQKTDTLWVALQHCVGRSDLD